MVKSSSLTVRPQQNQRFGPWLTRLRVKRRHHLHKTILIIPTIITLCPILITHCTIVIFKGTITIITIAMEVALVVVVAVVMAILTIRRRV